MREANIILLRMYNYHNILRKMVPTVTIHIYEIYNI